MNESTTKTITLHNVPSSVADLQAARATQAKLSDTDRMESYVLAIWESDEMVPFKIAMDKGDVFVEGSPRADDQEIARLAREAARANRDKIVGGWDLDHCRRVVGSVLRRFATSRLQLARKQAAQ